MMDRCYFLWAHELPGGSCAQWFAASATVAAVFTALGAHFYTAWRQSKQEARSDSAFAAGIALLVRRVLEEAEANFSMFVESKDEAILNDHKFIITRPLSGVQAVALPSLDNNEALLLLRSKDKTLAPRIEKAISDINLNNLAIEEYASRRKDFIPIGEAVSDYIKSCKGDSYDDEHATVVRCRMRLEDMSSTVAEMTGRTFRELVSARSVVDDFNKLSSKKGPFFGLGVIYDKEIDELISRFASRMSEEAEGFK